MSQNLVPWHMWGNVQTARIALGGNPLGGETTQQLVRIAYARPETWSFLFSVKLVQASRLPLPADNDGNVSVHYDLTVGIGRSQVSIEDFAVFVFDYGNQFPPVGRTLFANSVADRQILDGGLVTSSARLVDICAQDIQLTSRMVLVNNTVAVPVDATCEIHAYFSPKTHVRPEWFGAGDQGFYGSGSTIPRFPGGEDKGT